jgi:hypothetical protein
MILAVYSLHKRKGPEHCAPGLFVCGVQPEDLAACLFHPVDRFQGFFRLDSAKWTVVKRKGLISQAFQESNGAPSIKPTWQLYLFFVSPYGAYVTLILDSDT